ncbi:MAG: cryptochrome/photolyase family protein [Luteimonas sp.]
MHAIVWFRNDLRLADNPALQAALRAGLAPIPVYIHAPEEEGDWRPGAASNTWRARSLGALDADLRRIGSRLNVLPGPTLATLETIIAATAAEAVFWNRRYEPAIEARDATIKRALRGRGLRVESHNGSLLFEPWQVETKTGDPYRVFTPFWRTALSQWRLPATFPAPDALPAVAELPGAVSIESLGLAPRLPWDSGFWQTWVPGEQGAHQALRRFREQALQHYALARDRPDQIGTSRLSPHLHFGEVSVWQAVRAIDEVASVDRDTFVRELGWREFAHHVMHHFPETPERNFNPRFDDFPWASVPTADLEAWQRGFTGIPIVDAGMRELWHRGWMHNRVRMIVASFLTKNLRAHWQHGARWFWDTLVDADLASNSLGWQWVAGTGVDAAPFVRVFNPVLQARKFDPSGAYIAHWVPELRGLPVELRHEPWLQPELIRRHAAGYPQRPIVELSTSRQAALAAFAQMRAGRG